LPLPKVSDRLNSACNFSSHTTFLTVFHLFFVVNHHFRSLPSPRIFLWNQRPFLPYNFSQWPKPLPRCRNPISTAPLRRAPAKPTTCSINIYRQHSRRTTLAFNQWPSILMATSGTPTSGAASLLLNSVGSICISASTYAARNTAVDSPVMTPTDCAAQQA
jgi:hypothetical protein